MPLKCEPSYIAEPSAGLMVAACLTWTVLEWSLYESNAEDRYQLPILGLATCLGLLPAIGCLSNVLGIMFCTMPWAMHLGLVVSEVLHMVDRYRTFARKVQVV
jgi:hypothetical protein